MRVPPAGPRRVPAGSPRLSLSSSLHAGQLEADPVSDGADRKDMVGPARLQRGVGHTIDGGALAILGDSDSARVVDQAESLRAVAAQSREHHADGAAAES